MPTGSRPPAVALLGPRQVGKTTLALEVARGRAALYLDLESEPDRSKLVILDEIQRASADVPHIRDFRRCRSLRAVVTCRLIHHGRGVAVGRKHGLVHYALLVIALGFALPGCTVQSHSPVSPEPGDRETLRSLDTGTVLGYANPFGGYTWLGVPYAAPPVGALRWAAPRPAPAWPGVRNVLLPGEPCIQFGSPLGGVGPAGSQQGSEDCLYLNVYAPKLDADADADARARARLPVMVWIHGGGNTIGAASFRVAAGREPVPPRVARCFAPPADSAATPGPTRHGSASPTAAATASGFRGRRPPRPTRDEVLTPWA